MFDANERAQAVVPKIPSPIHYNGTLVTLTWNGLTGLTEGWTYARVRGDFDAADVENPTGLAHSGEVEDYRMQLKDLYDFGDAPESYGTLLKDNGPRHLINNDPVIFNGIDPTAEDDGKPSILADADTYSITNSLGDLKKTATSYNTEVTINNQSTQNAMLSGWVDFNRNGVFDDNERAQAVVNPGYHSVTLSWGGLSGLTPGRTYARLRVATSPSEVASPYGLANSGEVDDYTLQITTPLPVDLISFQEQWIEGQGNQLTWQTAWERDNDHFDIQSSSDAKSFETVGRLTGTGTTKARQTYSFMDTQPVAHLTYYRLKQVDANGTFTNSSIVAVRQGDQPGRPAGCVWFSRLPQPQF